MTMTTIGDALDRQVGARGDCDAVVDPGRGLLTYRDLARHADELAERLQALGVSRGDRVAVMLPNCAEYCVSYVALMRLGAVLVAVNHRYRPDELRYAIEHSQASAVIFDEAIEAANRRLLRQLSGGLADGDLPGLRLIEVDCAAGYLSPREWSGDGHGVGAGAAFDRGGTPADGESAADQPAVVIFTSGTTGRPKGAVLSQRNVLASAYGYGERLGVGEEDRISVFTPMFHAGGLVNGATMALLYGAAAVLLPRFELAAARRALAEHAVSVYLAVPTMLVAHCEEDEGPLDLPALRVIVTGGSAVHPRLLRQTRERFGPRVNLHVVYGLSEANMATVTEPLDLDRLGETAPVGRATCEFEVKVEGADAVGEVLIRGNGVFIGYWNDEAATAAALSDDGWFRTGDLGQVDATGELTIVGRKKDMYIRGGANVYPAEVERVLEAHPSVLHAAVIGVPDERLGEVGKAVLTPAPGAEIVPEDVLAFAAERLASYKLPASIEVRDSLPLTPFGKIWKSKLREELA